MVSGHVEAHFSAAYDGELSPDARGAFDRHLAECSGCAAAFAELTTAVDALREQPTARMPHPVRLPEGSPVPERRWFGLPALLPRGRRLVAGLTAAGVVAAAGVAAALVISGGSLARDTTQSAASSGSLAGPYSGSAGNVSVLPQVSVPSANSAPPAHSALCASQTLGISATSADQIPDGFNTRVTQDDGITDVILAAPSFDYTPGETVDVYARIIDDATEAVSLPCTLLVGPEAAGSGAALTVPATAAPATPAGALTYGGQPVLEVVVPGAAVAGETYQIVAEVPAGAGQTQATEVTLSIQVT
jgi:anti-sigma factor RsiW